MVRSYKITKTVTLSALLVGSAVYAEPTFILKNGSSVGAIQVNIMQYGNSISGGLIPIAKSGEYATNIPVKNNPTTIELHYCKTSSSCKTELPEKLIAQFPKGKTIYIKFDGKQLEAQKGSFGKTTGKYSGLSMDNNLTNNEIKITHAKTSKAELGVGGSYKQEPTLTGVGKTGPVKPGSPMQSPAVGGATFVEKPAKPTDESQHTETGIKSGKEQAWEQFPAGNKIRRSTLTYDAKGEQFNRAQAFAAVLGVDVKGTPAEFKKAYFKLSREWHPDKHPDNAALASSVQALLNEAYTYLK